jgi:hypothetical protein
MPILMEIVAMMPNYLNNCWLAKKRLGLYSGGTRDDFNKLLGDDSLSSSVERQSQLGNHVA